MSRFKRDIKSLAIKTLLGRGDISRKPFPKPIPIKVEPVLEEENRNLEGDLPARQSGEESAHSAAFIQVSSDDGQFTAVPLEIYTQSGEIESTAIPVELCDFTVLDYCTIQDTTAIPDNAIHITYTDPEERSGVEQPPCDLVPQTPPSSLVPEQEPPSGHVPEQQPPSGLVPEQQPHSGLVPEQQPHGGLVPEQQPYSGLVPEQQPYSGLVPERQPHSGLVPQHHQLECDLVPEQQHTEQWPTGIVNKQRYTGTVPQKQQNSVMFEQQLVLAAEQQKSGIGLEPQCIDLEPELQNRNEASKQKHRNTASRQKQTGLHPEKQGSNMKYKQIGDNFLRQEKQTNSLFSKQQHSDLQMINNEQQQLNDIARQQKFSEQLLGGAELVPHKGIKQQNNKTGIILVPQKGIKQQNNKIGNIPNRGEAGLAQLLKGSPVSVQTSAAATALVQSNGAGMIQKEGQFSAQTPVAGTGFMRSSDLVSPRIAADREGFFQNRKEFDPKGGTLPVQSSLVQCSGAVTEQIPAAGASTSAFGAPFNGLPARKQDNAQKSVKLMRVAPSTPPLHSPGSSPVSPIGRPPPLPMKVMRRLKDKATLVAIFKATMNCPHGRQQSKDNQPRQYFVAVFNVGSLFINWEQSQPLKYEFLKKCGTTFDIELFQVDQTRTSFDHVEMKLSIQTIRAPKPGSAVKAVSDIENGKRFYLQQSAVTRVDGFFIKEYGARWVIKTTLLDMTDKIVGENINPDLVCLKTRILTTRESPSRPPVARHNDVVLPPRQVPEAYAGNTSESQIISHPEPTHSLPVRPVNISPIISSSFRPVLSQRRPSATIVSSPAPSFASSPLSSVPLLTPPITTTVSFNIRPLVSLSLTSTRPSSMPVIMTSSASSDLSYILSTSSNASRMSIQTSSNSSFPGDLVPLPAAYPALNSEQIQQCTQCHICRVVFRWAIELLFHFHNNSACLKGFNLSGVLMKQNASRLYQKLTNFMAKRVPIPRDRLICRCGNESETVLLYCLHCDKHALKSIGESLCCCLCTGLFQVPFHFFKHKCTKNMQKRPTLNSIANASESPEMYPKVPSEVLNSILTCPVPHCRKRYDYISGLLSHMRRQCFQSLANSGSIRTDGSFIYHDLLTRVTNIKTEPVICELCGDHLLSQTAYCMHKDHHRIGVQLHCKGCNVEFLTPCAFYRHVCGDNSNLPWCIFCKRLENATVSKPPSAEIPVIDLDDEDEGDDTIEYSSPTTQPSNPIPEVDLTSSPKSSQVELSSPRSPPRLLIEMESPPETGVNQFEGRDVTNTNMDQEVLTSYLDEHSGIQIMESDDSVPSTSHSGEPSTKSSCNSQYEPTQNLPAAPVSSSLTKVDQVAVSSQAIEPLMELKPKCKMESEKSLIKKMIPKVTKMETIPHDLSITTKESNMQKSVEIHVPNENIKHENDKKISKLSIPLPIVSFDISSQNEPAKSSTKLVYRGPSTVPDGDSKEGCKKNSTKFNSQDTPKILDKSYKNEPKKYSIKLDPSGPVIVPDLSSKCKPLKIENSIVVDKSSVCESEKCPTKLSSCESSKMAAVSSKCESTKSSVKLNFPEISSTIAAHEKTKAESCSKTPVVPDTKAKEVSSPSTLQSSVKIEPPIRSFQVIAFRNETILDDPFDFPDENMSTEESNKRKSDDKLTTPPIVIKRPRMTRSEIELLFSDESDSDTEEEDTEDSEESWFCCEDCDPLTVFPLLKGATKKCEKSSAHNTIKKINPVNNVNVRLENVTKDRLYSRLVMERLSEFEKPKPGIKLKITKGSCGRKISLL